MDAAITTLNGFLLASAFIGLSAGSVDPRFEGALDSSVLYGGLAFIFLLCSTVLAFAGDMIKIVEDDRCEKRKDTAPDEAPKPDHHFLQILLSVLSFLFHLTGLGFIISTVFLIVYARLALEIPSGYDHSSWAHFRYAAIPALSLAGAVIGAGFLWYCAVRPHMCSEDVDYEIGSCGANCCDSAASNRWGVQCLGDTASSTFLCLCWPCTTLYDCVCRPRKPQEAQQTAKGKEKAKIEPDVEEGQGRQAEKRSG